MTLERAASRAAGMQPDLGCSLRHVLERPAITADGALKAGLGMVLQPERREAEAAKEPPEPLLELLLHSQPAETPRSPAHLGKPSSHYRALGVGTRPLPVEGHCRCVAPAVARSPGCRLPALPGSPRLGYHFRCLCLFPPGLPLARQGPAEPPVARRSPSAVASSPIVPAE